MAMDEFVMDLKAAAYGYFQGVFAITSKVKPRTREKDPITKLPYYKVWILLMGTDSNRVYSAYCTCKGG